MLIKNNLTTKAASNNFGRTQMIPLGLGVDILKTSRLLELFKRNPPHLLIKRILSHEEQDQLYIKSNSHLINSLWSNEIKNENHQLVKYLAKVWTIKEAAYKAAYPSFHLSWKDISVFSKDKKPLVNYHTVKSIHSFVSLSHDSDLTMASVMTYHLMDHTNKSNN